MEKVSHIRDKLIELSAIAETYYASGLTSSILATKTESGYYSPSILHANVGKLWTAKLFHESVRLVQEIAGGLIDTVPSISDWRNSELQPFLEKYLKGKADVPTEYRLRLFRLLQDLTTYGIACYWLTLSAVGAGSPQGAKIMIQRETGYGFKEKLAKTLAGIPI